MTAESEAVVGELVPAVDVPGQRDDDGARWLRELGIVHQWLAELKGGTRRAYAAAIGWPYSLATGEFRPEAAEYRGGKTWLAWCARNRVFLLDAGREHVAAWAETLRTPSEDGRALSASTIAHTFTVANAFYIWAVQAGATTINPMALVNRRNLGVDLKKGPSPTRSITDDEAGKMLAQADREATTVTGKRNAALLALLLALGIRIAEAVHLRMDSLQWTGGFRVAELRLKGGRAHYLPIPPEVSVRLDAYLEARGAGAEVARAGDRGVSPPLFVTASGRQLLERSASKWLKRLARDAGVEHPELVSPHALRHGHITELREQDVEGAKIQKHIGHRNADTTERYGHRVADLAKSPAFLAARVFEEAAGRYRKG